MATRIPLVNSGAEVARLHTQLQQLGFLLPKSEVEANSFGPGTQKAVQKFQKQNGLSVTGTVDEQTAAKLAALSSASPQPESHQAASPRPSPRSRRSSPQPLPQPSASSQPGSPAPTSPQPGSPHLVSPSVTLVQPPSGPLVDAPTNPTVGGTLIYDNNGSLAAGITVRIYNMGFGGQETKVGDTKTDPQGNYSVSYAPAAGAASNLQVRVLDPAGKEVTISDTIFNAPPQETLNLVVPASVQPLASEVDRLISDINKHIGGIAQLAKAEESATRQDLTLLGQNTNWDSRLLALLAIASQKAATTGLDARVLYALYRFGMPSDDKLALVSPDTVRAALTKASKAGIVNLSDQQISIAVTAFQAFATKTRLAMTAEGCVSSFGDLLPPPSMGDTSKFVDLYFSNLSADGDFWNQAAKLGLPAQTLEQLRGQAPLLYLGKNNLKLAQKLQADIGSVANLPKLVDLDYHKPETWANVLTTLAGTGGDAALAALIPPAYTGATTKDRLTAYIGYMARLVGLSFPTHRVARMFETGDLAIPSAATAATAADQKKVRTEVVGFLRSASALGFNLGRTPLNTFLANHTSGLPALGDTSKQSLKILHRLYQVTPSTEALQAALKLGLTSAFHIASYSKTDFTARYSYAFPAGEADLVYGQAQIVSSATFNAFVNAKALDISAPVYALSSSNGDREDAKNALVQRFPSMENLFGNQDFCQCEDCRSVLSPAAYFVDLLDMLGQQQSKTNAAGNTPLDVLIGKQNGVAGRRPDLGALPLTCENTNTALPYIDLVNEIFEYYIRQNNTLDGGAAYDTGSATTADLTAEPEHVIPDVYTKTLSKAVYPLNLPFDLWIETVRGFLNYFRIPLAKVLDTFRPADNLELFSDSNSYPYYRAQILAESLGVSPAEYSVFTATDTTKWFILYGYPDENTALNGGPDPTHPGHVFSPLSSAKNLAGVLGLSYQELTDLVKTGFLNPGLYPLILQFERFQIDMGTAFSFTHQPGSLPLTQQETDDFQTLLDGITARYKQQDAASTFDGKTWLTKLLSAKYSSTVLVLADPKMGCDFSATTLRYADGSAAQALDFVKLNLFVRLWKKLGWTMEETDRALQAFFPASLPAFSDAGFTKAFGDAWKTALVYLAHLDELNTRLAPALGRIALLPLWADLPTQGDNPLYAQLFLTPSVLNNDFAFDDPNGGFPVPATDLTPQQAPLSAHAAAVQGALGLKAAEIDAIMNDAGVAAPAAFSLANLSLCYRYSVLAQCLQLSVSDMIALKALSGLNPFQKVSGSALKTVADDILLNQTLAFVKQVGTVQNSGFTVEDLQYLLRHQFDPVGKYQSDPNALLAPVQSVASGLRQIQAQNSVPDLSALPEALIDQRLSGLFPAVILKTLFAHLTNSQTYAASAASAAPLKPEDFAQAPEVALSYDSTTNTQTLSIKGLLLDWRKAEIQALNTDAALNTVFGSLLSGAQQQAQTALANSIAAVLGVWANLVQYEAVALGVPEIANTDNLAQQDASLSFSYNQTSQLQWLGYRGVLTDAKLATLTSINNSTTLAGLLNDVQQQTRSDYEELTGSLLAMWCNVQTYKAAQGGVAPANQIDVALFSKAVATAQLNGAITDPVPVIQITYDPSAQVQTLTCSGALTHDMNARLAALITSPVLISLLQNVRDQAVGEFQFLAAGLFAPTIKDPDQFVGPFLGADPAKQQKSAKAELVKVFLPLLTRKLSRRFVLQTLSANLGADASLTEALVTDAALLSDPSTPGRSLLQSFLAAGQQGVSASYYSSPNPVGTPQTSAMAGTTDTADPSNNIPATGSCHFEGYLQVPSDGPYRFFAELGDVGAAASLTIDSPDPTALFKNPIIPPSMTAAKAGNEVSQFVQLTAGLGYHFSLDFSKLGANGARLLVQGETLPKGPLSQLVLLPEQAVGAFVRAQMLLSKVVQILKVTALNLREVSYFAQNAEDFNNLTLSAFPTQASDDSAPKAAALFSQFLTLADYADLRKSPAGGSDGLINVFQAARQAGDAATLLAHLTRRDPQVVYDVAAALGTDPHFSNNAGIRRTWEALQLVQILGLPVKSIGDSTAIVAANVPSPDVAANFKNAVKAQYAADRWRPIAQSVYDPLRQKKRDALASYLVNALGLESSNQLFEYFLVDPGMEPVVQTSRLRLALSSVQTFIQRCFLNLENGNSDSARNVSASSIPVDWWAWMKRYRVWQANREIFLFPENWMQPELRQDKTDLFQGLESALLQGDVTRDLVESAFSDYLKGLELRARLDIVATYLDQNAANPGESTLYVLGRTYGQPHKYFYRTYAYSTGVWSNWEPVTFDIEGDHIVLVIWRGRLNLFWVTFLVNPVPSFGNGPVRDSSGAIILNANPQDRSFSDLASQPISSVTPKKQVQVQLHWSEFVQGKWSDRISTDLSKAEAIPTTPEFDSKNVHIHVSKELNNGVDGAVRIHLDGLRVHEESQDDRDNTSQLDPYAFRVTSKNCDPDFGPQYWEPPQFVFYDVWGASPTEYPEYPPGSAKLTATFPNAITSGGSSTQKTEDILDTVDNFDLLTTGNPVVPPFLDPGETQYWNVGGLISPFFFRDVNNPNASSQGEYRDERTFFVQPSLAETLIHEWQGWAIPPLSMAETWADPKIVDHINIVAQVPGAGTLPIKSGDFAHSVVPMQSLTDWVTDPSVAIAYGGVAIGKNGGIRTAGLANRLLSAGSAVSRGAGSPSTGLLVIGNQGVNLSQLRTLPAAGTRPGIVVRP